jgi:hypothetical protein
MITAEVEEIVDPIMGREETLSLPGRLEPLHLPFASARWLVRVLRPVVQPFVLPVLNAGQDLSLGSGITGQLVRDHDTRRTHLLLEMGWTAPERH